MPEAFTRVASTDQLPPHSMMLVEISRYERVLLVNLDGSYYAVEELCPHSGAALSEGDLHKEYVECPLHSSIFNVKTGKVMTPPASEDLIVYPVRVEGEDILIGPPS